MENLLKFLSIFSLLLALFAVGYTVNKALNEKPQEGNITLGKYSGETRTIINQTDCEIRLIAIKGDCKLYAITKVDGKYSSILWSVCKNGYSSALN